MRSFDSALSRHATMGRALDSPRTPEPLEVPGSQPQCPPPPRTRLRLRRNAPKLKSNTQQFLESVDSADVPIPSIEEPQVYNEEDMITDSLLPVSDLFHHSVDSSFSHASFENPRKSLSPPKTPAPNEQLSPAGAIKWCRVDLDSIDYSESEFSRPSTARSSGTFASVFSQLSHLSEDHFSGNHGSHSALGTRQDNTVKAPARPPTIKRAHWSQPMEQHLWKTYMMYQQDATVTPYKLGPNNVPPPGVLDRVASIAKQTWRHSCASSGVDTSLVPEWPHSRAAARAHLRELCVSQVRRSSRTPQIRDRSVTPSYPTAVRFKNRRLGLTPSPNPFAGRDMEMSLAVSTSASMQPNGPLAQLARVTPEYTQPEPLYSLSGAESLSNDESVFQEPRTVPSMSSHTYGPNSTYPEEGYDAPSPWLQSQTLAVDGPKRLGSPANVEDEQSNTGKRRARQSMLEPPRAKRPSLTLDLWMDPSASSQHVQIGSSSPVKPNMFSPGAASDSSPPKRSIEGPHLNLLEQLNAVDSYERAADTGFEASAHLTPPEVPQRLGSPFSRRLPSFSFPGRIRRHREVPRAFATLTPASTGRVKTPKTPVPRRAIEERLRDLCRRAGRRSRTPQ